MAAPGPPVTKLQCTASLAGARPAGFTSVPWEGHCRLRRSSSLPRLLSAGLSLEWSARGRHGRDTPMQRYVSAAPGPCRVRARPGTRLVAGPEPGQMACPIRTLSVEKQGEVPLPGQGGSGGIPRPFEGGIGGPGGHRGEVGIPPAPLAGGAIPQRKNDLANAKTFYRLESCTWKRRKPLLQHANAPCHRISAAGGTLYRLVCSRGITPQHPPGRTAPPASARRR